MQISLSLYKYLHKMGSHRLQMSLARYFLISSLLIDMTDGYQNNKGHPRRLSLGDERTLRTLHKLQKELLLFTPK